MCGAQIDSKTSKKVSRGAQNVPKSIKKSVKKHPGGTRGLPGDALGAQRVHHQKQSGKREIIRLPRGTQNSHILQNNQKKMNLERFFGAPVRSTGFCRKITGKGSTQDGGIVVIYKVESKKSLFRPTAEKGGFGTHLLPF